MSSGPHVVGGADSHSRSGKPQTLRQQTTGLECFALNPSPPPLVPASPFRDWMDNFPGKHPYRCLPMAIANAHGWEVLSPCSLEVEWNGGPERSDIQFRCLDDYPFLEHIVESNFSNGIVTFHTGYLFRTSPGWHLLATGPFNRPKDGASPLTGVVETDWLPYPFTMNWQLTRPGRTLFERGEPICLVMPILSGALQPITPVIRNLSDDAELEKKYWNWRVSRAGFIERLQQSDAAATKEAWQRFYFKGEYPGTVDRPSVHITKLRLSMPTDRRERSDGETHPAEV